VEVMTAGFFSSGVIVFKCFGHLKKGRNHLLSVYGYLRSWIVVYDRNPYRLSNCRSNFCP